MDCIPFVIQVFEKIQYSHIYVLLLILTFDMVDREKLREVIISKGVLNYTTLLKKYPTFFCENLVDFNEAQLHEATLNPHTHTWIVSACQ